MKVLHTYTMTRLEDEKATHDYAIEARLAGFSVESVWVPTGDKYAYWRLVRERWAKDDLVFLEQDIVPSSLDDLKRFETCPEQVCAQAYLIMGRSDAMLLPPRLVHRNVERWGEADTSPPVGTEWTDVFALGFTRIRKEAQLQAGFLKWPSLWYQFDTELSDRFYAKGIRAHIHYPLAEHRHQEPKVKHDAKVRIAGTFKEFDKLTHAAGSAVWLGTDTPQATAVARLEPSSPDGYLHTDKAKASQNANAEGVWHTEDTDV